MNPEPSPQARRAAEIINEATDPDVRDGYIREDAETIERVTGVGDAIKLIQNLEAAFCDESALPESMRKDAIAQARYFLSKHD